MEMGNRDTGYEGLYECLSCVTLPVGTKADEGDLALESDLRGHESRYLAEGEIRLVGYVRRGSRLN